MTFLFLFMGHCNKVLSNPFLPRNKGAEEGVLVSKGVSRGSINGGLSIRSWGRDS